MPESLIDRCGRIEKEAVSSLAACKTVEDYNSWRVTFLGKKGKIKELFNELEKLSASEKPQVGKVLTTARKKLEEEFSRAFELAQREARKDPTFDPTLPGTYHEAGRKHLIYQTIEQLEEIFRTLGFESVDGPEIESVDNNFFKLNVPPTHPSVDDAFYVSDSMVLRSHTSPVQIRTMLERRPPIRVIVPGKVFRPDTIDASHLPIFHQIEGLMVDTDVTFRQLKGVLNYFVQMFFGPEYRTRFRPSFFPFTEPSAEMDISCILCGGNGCPACKQTGFMEILGCGMVHPNVFRNCNIDPAKYTGFAFGMGVERIAMLRYRISDIRVFMENKPHFLKQF